MTSRHDLIKAGAIAIAAGAVPSSVAFADLGPSNIDAPRAPSGQAALAWSSPEMENQKRGPPPVPSAYCCHPPPSAR
jgi:hypothetical protein